MIQKTNSTLKFYWLLFILLSASATNTLAQSDCADLYDHFTSPGYNDRKLITAEEIINLLDGCVTKNGIKSTENKQNKKINQQLFKSNYNILDEIYRQAAAFYYSANDSKQGEKYLKLLRLKQSNYRFDEDRDKYLPWLRQIKDYKEYPQLYFGVNSGYNLTKANRRQSEFAVLPIQPELDKYKKSSGGQVGITLEMAISDTFKKLKITPLVGIEPGFILQNFNHKLNYSESVFDINYTDEIWSISLPAYMKFQVETWDRYKPFLAVGAFGNLLYAATRDYLGQNNVESLNRFTKANYGALGSVGLRYVLSNNGNSKRLTMLQAEFRYLHGISRINSSNRYFSDGFQSNENDDFLFDNFYVQNNISQKSMQINIGLIIVLHHKVYKIKEKK